MKGSTAGCVQERRNRTTISTMEARRRAAVAGAEKSRLKIRPKVCWLETLKNDGTFGILVGGVINFEHLRHYNCLMKLIFGEMERGDDYNAEKYQVQIDFAHRYENHQHFLQSHQD